MKVLVTGGAGFIGSHIVDRLLEKGHQPVVLDNLSTGDEGYLHPEVPFYRMDVQSEAVDEVFRKEKPDAVIHQAAQSQVPRSIEAPIEDAQTNLLGTIRLLEGCRHHGAKKFIYASSAAVYGNPQDLPIDEEHPVSPLSPYGISKLTPERYIRVYQELYGLTYTIFRYANVYGIRQVPHGEGAVISIFVDRLLHDRPLTIFGDGKQTRDYIYVDDIARANVAALDRGDGETLNIGTGVRTSLNDLVETVESITGRKIEVEYGPDRPGDIKHSYFKIDRALKYLDWSPLTSLEQGLSRTLSYYGVKVK
ncbi:MAG: SDR family oxidoreductase [Firmicutes bacterium]|uniref:UDP-glucose 4-epimerase n=1 Tax=Melghirimyces thermohalophilus TaxID=1236220 RepID=A0A1G6ME91_9BACL|nr:SDR family oxidoreductase [Melghirimyces thermohalophilus]MDA8353268.1 SDR family oxidoreductase [Bacillota bacterium]SDC53790.1 UDP-glucose 4-epimerase [Melghirimyces thermohalophilus]